MKELKKYVVTIPEQEYVVEAEDEDDALDIAKDLIDIEVSDKDEDNGTDYTFPLKNQNEEYYIRKLLDDRRFSAVNRYMHYDGFCVFTDGCRIIMAKNTWNDAQWYPERIGENARTNFEKYISENVWNDATNKIKISSDDVLAVLDNAQRDGKSIRNVKYSFTVNGIKHIVKAYFLLEAMYFCETDIIHVGSDKCSSVYLKNNTGDRKIMILPMDYDS